jgi:hypothetical protein
MKTRRYQAGTRRVRTPDPINPVRQSMSFDLRIEFFGLALFAPEGKEKMHVLLPVHDAMPDGKGRHYARLVYDLAYEDPKATQLKRQYKFVSLEGRVLELMGLSSQPLDVNITSEIFHLGQIADDVDPALVTGSPSGAIMARVSMDRGALTRHEMGALYGTVANPPARMATRSEWTIRGIEGDSFSFANRLSGPTGASEPSILRPLNQTIHVTVYDALIGDMPPNGPYNIPKAPGPSEHFHAYYQICTPRIPHDHLPTPAGRKRVPVFGDVPTGAQFESGGLTCVQTQSNVKKPAGT